MVHAAILDVVNAIEQTAGYYITLEAPAGTNLQAAIAGAAEAILAYVYPAQAATFTTILTDTLATVPDGPGKTDGLALGRTVADAILAIRAKDGWDNYMDYVPGDETGAWQPTKPMFDVALLPQWASLEPFAMTASDQFRPAGPPELQSQAYTDAYNEVRSLGRADSETRTPEQLQIARFWADGPGTITPSGHWNQIAGQIALAQGNSIGENARLFARLNLALADAAIAAWDAKYAYSSWRPVTAIQNGDLDGNDLTTGESAWTPFLITPPFPEYISGHSTFSSAAAAILTATFGDNLAFTTNSPGLPGVTRSFASFTAAAQEAGQSRIYGGIHFQFGNQDGLAVGRAVANHVLARFSLTSDTQPPRVLLGQHTVVSAANISLTGRVLDNLAGVASLEVQVDGGTWTAVAFNSQGRFAIPTGLPLSGTADGEHLFQLRARDTLGNTSVPVHAHFTLDTLAPVIAITSPIAGESLAAGALLSGAIGGDGSALTQLTYAFDGGIPHPILFAPAGEDFETPLDLSKLAVGNHTLTVQVRDQAGNTATTTLAVSLAAPIPLTILGHTPLDGAVEVGSTFKPKVVFSRPIDPTSLTSTNFFATDAGGNRLAANITPADDGTFAWLFFQDPMPGGSYVTVHIDGATIRAAEDGQSLDADLDGSPGGTREFTFTTVSLMPLAGTTLSGKVVDPGPDLKPMTFDDFRAGPDQILHTVDDVFLRPLAGVKVLILGLEQNAVFTDAEGNFHFDASPAGNVKLAIDGRTATNAPAGFYFPEMVMDQFLRVGAANTVMGTMGTREERAANLDRPEVYLPRLQTSLLKDVSGDQPVTIGVDAVSAPNLTPEQRALLTIEVQPGSLIDENGNPVAAGQVGISTVPPELVRDMLPPGVLQHTFDITIQTVASPISPRRQR